MLKRDAISNPKSCLNKAAPDEPIFILRAKDPRASETVRRWVALSQLEQEPAKLNEARRIATRMEEWRKNHVAEELKEAEKRRVKKQSRDARESREKKSPFPAPSLAQLRAFFRPL